MSNLFKMFEMDVDLEREGITVNYGSVKLLLARAGGRNKEFRDYLNARARKVRHQIDQETMSDDAADLMMAEAYAEKVVLGWWSRIEDKFEEPVLKNGEEQWVDTVLMPLKTDETKMKPVKFSVPECVRLFTLLPDLFADVQRMAGKAANYRKVLDEEDEGNLEES